MIARASSSQVHHGQPSECPSVSGTSSAVSVAANITVPGRSTPTGCGVRVAGTSREATSRTITPIGTMTRKIGRHEVPAMSALTSSPPASWPTTAAMPDVAPYKARARAFRSPSRVWWNVASTCGISIAAAAPWTIRAAISTPAAGASLRRASSRQASAVSNAPQRREALASGAGAPARHQNRQLCADLDQRADRPVPRGADTLQQTEAAAHSGGDARRVQARTDYTMWKRRLRPWQPQIIIRASCFDAAVRRRLWRRDLGPGDDPQPRAIRLAAQHLDPPRAGPSGPRVPVLVKGTALSVESGVTRRRP